MTRCNSTIDPAAVPLRSCLLERDEAPEVLKVHGQQALLHFSKAGHHSLIRKNGAHVKLCRHPKLFFAAEAA